MNQQSETLQENVASTDDVVSDPDTGAESNTKSGPNAGAIRKSTTNSILKAAQNATGMEFSSVEDMMSALARLSAQSATQGQPESKKTKSANTGTDEGETAAERRQRITNNDLADQMAAMKLEMEMKEQRLREKELDGTIRSAMGDRFDGDLTEYTINKIRENLVEQDGEWIVVNSRNQQRYTGDGRPMEIRDLVEELAKNNPKLLKQLPPGNGSGLRPQSGYVQSGLPGDDEFVPDYTKDPAAFNAWANKRGLGKGAGLKGIGASVYNSTSTRKTWGSGQ